MHGWTHSRKSGCLLANSRCRPDPGAAAATRNLRLVLEYDGGAYCGWQRQINGLSIQQVLEEAIGRSPARRSA